MAWSKGGGLLHIRLGFYNAERDLLPLIKV